MTVSVLLVGCHLTSAVTAVKAELHTPPHGFGEVGRGDDSWAAVSPTRHTSGQSPASALMISTATTTQIRLSRDTASDPSP